MIYLRKTAGRAAYNLPSFFIFFKASYNNISFEKLLEAIEQNKEEIFSNLVQYPAYFEDRLKFLL